MNKRQAHLIAKNEKITVGEIIELLKRAYDNGAANKTQSKINPHFSRAVAFNIFWRSYSEKDKDANCHYLGLRNVLREFGEYYNGEIPERSKVPPKPATWDHEPAINPHEAES